MFFSFVDGASAPLELVIWEMAERFGWTLDYIDALPLARLHEWEQVRDGRARGQAERDRRRRFLNGGK